MTNKPPAPANQTSCIDAPFALAKEFQQGYSQLNAHHRDVFQAVLRTLLYNLLAQERNPMTPYFQALGIKSQTNKE